MGQQTAGLRIRAVRATRPKGKRILYASAGGTAALGLGALAFTDDFRHGYEAVERTGRVVATLFVCINE